MTLGLPENYEVSDIPADMVDDAAAYREQLVEAAVEMDDDLMMAYMEAKSHLLRRSSVVSARARVP